MARRVTKRFALEEGGPKRLQVSCTRDCDDLTVLLDGAALRPNPGSDIHYTLPDGSALMVRAWPAGGEPRFALVHEGRHLPGTHFHPRTRVRTAALTLFALAGASLLLPVEAVVGLAPFLAALPLLPIALLLATVFALLGLAVLRCQRWAAWVGALLAALVFCALALPLFLSQAVGLEAWALPAGLFWLIYQSLDAIDELRAASA